MAWDLWSSPYDSWDIWGSSDDLVAPGSTCSLEPEWQCDFHFGYGRDLIEEDAINERCCIQVLKILITKAVTESAELEKDLVSLQSELAWAEHEEWSEICFNALREKIAWLDMSTWSLKSKDDNNIGVQLVMHREPAENIHDIVKALLRKYFPKKDEQTPKVIATKSSPDSPLPATGLLGGHKDLNKFDSKEELGEIGFSQGDRCTILKLQQKNTNDHKTIKPANTNIMDSSPDSVRLAAGYSDEKKISDSENAKQWEAKRQVLAPVEKKTSSMAFNNLQPANTDISDSRDYVRLEAGYSEEKKTSSMIFNNQQSENTNIMYSSPDSLRLVAGHSDKKKISDSENARQWETKGQGLAPVEKKISSMNFINKQPASANIMNVTADPLRLEAGYSDQKKTSVSERTRQWEAKGQGLAHEEKKLSQNTSLHDEENSMQYLEVTYATVKGSSTSVSCSDEKNISKNFDSKIMNEKVDECSSIPMADISKTIEFQIEQPADAIVKYVTADSPKYPNGCSSETENSCLPPFAENGYEEVRKQPSTATEKNPMLSSSLNPEMKAALQQTEKRVAIKKSSPSVSCHDEKSKLTNFDSVIINKMVEKHASIAVADIIGSSLRPDGLGIDVVKMVEHVTINTSSTSFRCPDEKNKLKNSDSKIMSEKVEEHTSIPMSDIVGSSRPDELGIDVVKSVEPADAIVKYFSSDSLKHPNGWSSEMKNSCMPQLTEKGYEEEGHQPSTAALKNQILNSSLNPERKAALQKIEKEPGNALVKYTSPDSWRQSAGINKRTECSESRLCASNQEKSENSDGEQKLIDFVPKTARKVGIKELKVVLANNMVLSSTCLKTGEDGSNNLQIFKFQEGGDLNKFGHFSLTSNDQMGKDTTKPKLNAGQAEESQKATVDLHKKPRVNLGLELQKPKTKRKSLSSMQNVQEPCFPSTDIVSKSKKERKSIIDDDSTSLMQFLSLMHLKKPVTHESSAKDRAWYLSRHRQSFTFTVRKEEEKDFNFAPYCRA